MDDPIDSELEVEQLLSTYEIIASLRHDYTLDPLLDPSILDPYYGYKVISQ